MVQATTIYQSVEVYFEYDFNIATNLFEAVFPGLIEEYRNRTDMVRILETYLGRRIWADLTDVNGIPRVAYSVEPVADVMNYYNPGLSDAANLLIAEEFMRMTGAGGTGGNGGNGGNGGRSVRLIEARRMEDLRPDSLTRQEYPEMFENLPPELNEIMFSDIVEMVLERTPKGRIVSVTGDSLSRPII